VQAKRPEVVLMEQSFVLLALRDLRTGSSLLTRLARASAQLRTDSSHLLGHALVSLHSKTV
jgi:hypothetical protein